MSDAVFGFTGGGDEDDDYEDQIPWITALRNGDVQTIREQISRGMDVNKLVIWRKEEMNVGLASRWPLEYTSNLSKPSSRYAQTHKYTSSPAKPSSTYGPAPEYTLNRPKKSRDRIGRLSDPDIDTDLPLHLAARSSWSATKLLLESGAEVDKTFAFAGETALQRAIAHGRNKEETLKIVQLLIRHGADVNAPAGPNGTALEAAVRKHNHDVFHLLLTADAEINQVDGHNYGTALTTAVDSRNPQAARILLDRGADPNALRAYGYGNALYSAALGSNVEIAKWLLDAGAKPDGVPNKGEETGISLPPLVTAAKCGNLEIVKLLLRHRANIDAIDSFGVSPVAAAALYNHLDVALWLLKHGADARIAAQTFRNSPKFPWSSEEVVEVLKAWEHAAVSQEYETAEALFGSIPCSPSKWHCLVATYQWELPKFIDECGDDKVVDTELMLTSTILHNADLAGETRHLRALTWADLVNAQTSQFPEISSFLAAIVREVAHYPRAVSSGNIDYTHDFHSPKSTIRVKCSWDSIDVTFDPDIPREFHMEVLWNLEVMCKSFRPSQVTENATLSKATWKLERYQVPIKEISAEESQELQLGAADDFGPVFDLRLAARLSNEALEITQHTCWQTLLNGGVNVVDLGSRGVEGLDSHSLDSGRPLVGKGLEMSFQMMITIAAMEFSLIIDGGVVFVGYETAIVPIEVIGDVAQFHLLTSDGTSAPTKNHHSFDGKTANKHDQKRSEEHNAAKYSGGQLNPYTMDLGSRLKTEDVLQFRNKRCFLGWCEFAQVNLGTSNLFARVGYSGGREKGQSTPFDGLTVVSQLGLPTPLSTVLGLEANFKRTSHRLHFTPFGGYAKLLRDTALEVVMVYDAGQKRGWLVPKLSLLLHMCQAYVLNCSIGSCSGVPYVNSHKDAVELITTLEAIGDRSVLDIPGDGLLFRQLLLGLNTNLLATVPLTQKSARGKLYGYEFMDVVTSPGRGSVMKQLDVATIKKYWLGIVNAVDAVVVCSDIGDVITAVRGTLVTSGGYRNSTTCNTLPDGIDYLAATISCLSRLVRRKGGELCAGGVPSPTPGRNSTNSIHGANGNFEGYRISDESLWNIEGDPFLPCSHDDSSADTCWKRASLLQRLAKHPYLRFSTPQRRVLTPAVSNIPISGAVVFGRFRG